MSGVGFTGTREGVTPAQWWSLANALHDAASHGRVPFHHGGCIGADEAAHNIARGLGFDLHVQPGIVPPALRGLCSGTATWYAAQPTLIRNRLIVNMTARLLAAPKGLYSLRSGTWATIRYARSMGRPVTIIWPDGSRNDDP